MTRKCAFVGDELLHALKSISSDLVQFKVTVYYHGTPGSDSVGGFKSFDAQLESASGEAIPHHYRSNIRSSTPWCNIYTSGTTGGFSFR